jgi:hypothetical protein
MRDAAPSAEAIERRTVLRRLTAAGFVALCPAAVFAAVSERKILLVEGWLLTEDDLHPEAPPAA